jgi:hypothetical protein
LLVEGKFFQQHFAGKCAGQVVIFPCHAVFNWYFWIGGDDVKIYIFLPDLGRMKFLGERTFDEMLPVLIDGSPRLQSG